MAIAGTVGISSVEAFVESVVSPLATERHQELGSRQAKRHESCKRPARDTFQPPFEQIHALLRNNARGRIFLRKTALEKGGDESETWAANGGPKSDQHSAPREPYRRAPQDAGLRELSGFLYLRPPPAGQAAHQRLRRPPLTSEPTCRTRMVEPSGSQRSMHLPRLVPTRKRPPLPPPPPPPDPSRE